VIVRTPTGQPQAANPGVLVAQPNAPLGSPLVARIVDPATGNSVPGAAVTWRIFAGGGTLSGETNVSDAQGLVRANFTMGPGPEDAVIRVTATESGSFFDFIVRNQRTVVEVPAKQVVTPQAQVAINTPTIQLHNIQLHLDNLRLLRNPTVAQGLNVTYDGQPLPSLGMLRGALTDTTGKPSTQRGGGASSDRDPFERFGVFIQGDVDIGKFDGSGSQQAFDVRTKGLTLGADYRFKGNHVLGAAIGVMKADTDLADDVGSNDAKGYSFSLFGEYVPFDKAYVDVTANFGRNRYESTRRVIGAAGDRVDYNGSVHGDQFGVSVVLGYQYFVDSLTLQPYGRVEYVDAKIDAFRESGGPDALEFGGQHYRSTVLSVGGQAHYSIAMSWGALVPYARAEYQYTAHSSADQVTAQLAGVAASNSVLPALGVDRNYGNIALGATALMPQGISGFFNYQHLLGKQDFREDRFTLGVRLDF
jgi:outer membrane autotransporter protein